MRTIKESILNSTNSGKNAPLTVEYLLKRGFYTMETNAGSIVCQDGRLTTHVLHYKTAGGKLYIWIRFYHKNEFVLKVIPTIKDLALIEKYWKSIDDSKRSESKKLLQEIIDNYEDAPFRSLEA